MDAVNRRLGISIVDQPSVGNPLEFCSSSRNKNSSCVLYLFYAGDWIRFFGFGEIFFFFSKILLANFTFLFLYSIENCGGCNCNSKRDLIAVRLVSQFVSKIRNGFLL